MKDTEAHTVLREMRDAALKEIPDLEAAVTEARKDWLEDPDPLMEWMINAAVEKLDRRKLEAEALALAVAKF